MRTQSTCNQPEARENAIDQVKPIGFGSVSDWFKKLRWRDFSKPITECSKAKPTQSRITFDTQLKIALSSLYGKTLQRIPYVSKLN